MRGLADVKRSLKEIKKPMDNQDFDVMVLDSLTDNEFGLIEEFRELYKAGFNAEEIEDIMGSESFSMAIAIMQRVEETIERLTTPPMIKLAKAKKRKLEVIDLCEDSDEEIDEDDAL